jgi:hypothetical protein
MKTLNKQGKNGHAEAARFLSDESLSLGDRSSV